VLMTGQIDLIIPKSYVESLVRCNNMTIAFIASYDMLPNMTVEVN